MNNEVNLGKSSFDNLGDRMKAYEGVESERRLDPRLPIMIRLDGRSFHTFTRGMERPFFLPMSQAMIETARYLVKETHACFAYTQSDEISLGYWNEGPQSQIMFDGRVQKLTSVIAAMATAKFNQETALRMPQKSHLLPVFDARVFSMPSLDEMANCILFRTSDCEKNSITMAASSCHSHKSLQGKNGLDKKMMMKEKGLDWDELPEFFKSGTFLKREQRMKDLTEAELSRIPENFRPSGPVQRTEVVEFIVPSFFSIENKTEFLFSGESPILKKMKITEEVEPVA